MARAPKGRPETDGDEAPQFRVREQAYIGLSLRPAGSVVTYTPEGDNAFVGANLEPVNDAAQALVNAQKQPHPDKEAGKPARSSKAAADAASAAVGGEGAEGEGDLV